MATSSNFEIPKTSTKFFIDYFKYFGVQLSNENIKHRISIRSYLIVIAGCLEMILSIFLSIQQWDHMNVRIKAFTKFGQYCICTLALAHLVLYPECCIQLFKLTNKPLDKYAKYWTSEQLMIRYDGNKRAKTVQKLYLYAGIALWFFSNFIPCIIEIFLLVIKPLENVTETDLFTSFYFIPYLTTNTKIIYCILAFIQSLIYLTMISTTSVYYSVVTTAIKILEAEVKILCVTVKNIGNNTNDLVKNDSDDLNLSFKTQNILKASFKQLIEHHQAIIISVTKLNEVAGFLLLAFNGVITAQLSLELYCTLEADEPWMHFLRTPGSVVCYGVMCFLGQGLINEADNLKKQIEWFPWVDIPQCLKKSLLMMVTCSKKPLEIKPSSLYVLNARNFMSVIQAAYSYLNMMRSFKANRGF